MAESATADASYYAYTLTHRPASPSTLESERARDPRLPAISARLATALPPEIRAYIYELAFGGNRVAVTASSGCYCAGQQRGPWRAEHRWLLALGEVKGEGMVETRRDAVRGFTERALWEVHCPGAWEEWVGVMRRAGVLGSVRDIGVNVFELSRECWEVQTGLLEGLRSVTFCPWQKGWTLDVAALEGSEELSDQNMMPLVRNILETKAGYGWMWEMVKMGREERGGWKLYFLLPVRYLHEVSRERKRWQLKVCFWFGVTL